MTNFPVSFDPQIPRQSTPAAAAAVKEISNGSSEVEVAVAATSAGFFLSGEGNAVDLVQN